MTFTGPDLSQAKVAVENLMDDRCRILRDPDWTRDDVVNSVTGQASSVNDDQLIYEGPCKCKIDFRPQMAQAGDGQENVAQYNVAIPIPVNPASEPHQGDRVVFLASRRDPALVGKVMRVSDIPVYKTFAIQRSMYCELHQPVVDRP